MLGLSNEDIEFLKELKTELITQNHVGQASPRFWVVRGTVKEYGIDSGWEDGTILVYDGDDVADNLDDAILHIKEEFEKELEEKRVTIEDKDPRSGYYVYKHYDRHGAQCSNFLTDLDDVHSLLEDCGVENFSVMKYKNIEKNFENTFFMTNKECKEHIKANYYHYPKDAHSYAMTAWRAPQVARLWGILEKINFEDN